MPDSLTLHAREAARAELARKVAIDRAAYRDAFYHCYGCDQIKVTADAFCPYCEAHTESWRWDEEPRRALNIPDFHPVPPRGVDPQLDAKFDAAERALAERNAA